MVSVEPALKAAFSQVISTREVFTGLVLSNPGSLIAEIKVGLYSVGGSLAGLVTLRLEAGRSVFRLVRELFPTAGDQVGGSIQLESDRPITAYQSFGSFHLDFLSAVKPTVIN